jgi:hypothetical protein
MVGDLGSHRQNPLDRVILSEAQSAGPVLLFRDGLPCFPQHVAVERLTTSAAAPKEETVPGFRERSSRALAIASLAISTVTLVATAVYIAVHEAVWHGPAGPVPGPLRRVEDALALCRMIGGLSALIFGVWAVWRRRSPLTWLALGLAIVAGFVGSLMLM